MQTADSKQERIVFTEFSKKSLEQARVASRIKPASYLPRRLDLRGKTVITFSGCCSNVPECALSLYRTRSGWELGVHIADVSEYVCEGSPLDTDAKERRATLNNQFIDVLMLPEAVTKDVCGLTVGQDKLALSVLLDISPDGRLISTKFEESVIRVAENCIYDEIDRAVFTKEISSIYALRQKYAPYKNIFLDLYELAAVFSNRRIEKGALDCTVFYKSETHDAANNTITEYISEPDSRAMIREIGYFAAEAIGNFMFVNKLPCIYIGQETISKEDVEKIEDIIGICSNDDDLALRTSHVINAAKGTDKYIDICNFIKSNLPCAQFSVEPIYNTHCASDKVVSFVRPATRYADLLTQRMLKICISAKGDVKNININRYRTVANEAAEKANEAEMFVYNCIFNQCK